MAPAIAKMANPDRRPGEIKTKLPHRWRIIEVLPELRLFCFGPKSQAYTSSASEFFANSGTPQAARFINATDSFFDRPRSERDPFLAGLPLHRRRSRHCDYRREFCRWHRPEPGWGFRAPDLFACRRLYLITYHTRPPARASRSGSCNSPCRI